MKRRLLSGILLSIALSVVGLQAQDNTVPKPPAPSSAKEPTSVAGPDYTIGADDVLHVSVWKEPDLTNTLPVRPDGKISLPLLNDVQAAGLTPMQLANSLT